MRHILILLLLPFIVKAQNDDTTKYSKYPNTYGIQYPRLWATKVLRVPTDTSNSKTGVAQINNRLFVGNGTYWTLASGGGSYSAGYGLNLTSSTFKVDSTVMMPKIDSNYLYITPTYFNANKASGSITGNSPTITSSKVPLTYWNGTNHIGYTNGATVDTACGNVAANTFYSGFSTVSASGTQITLTVLSIPNYLITGSGGQVIKLPDATTLPSGTIFTFNNNQTSGTITVNNNSNTLVTTIPAGGYASLVLNSNSIAAGSWDWHFSAPSAVQWSTNTFNLGNASITNATWNASVIGSNKGGAGSVTGILKADGSGNVSAATAGTDYQAPITLTTTGTSGAATLISNTLNIPQYGSGSGTVTSVATGFGLTGGTITTTGTLKVDSASVPTVTQTFSPIITLTDGATITWDATYGCNAKVTLAGTGRTLTISNAVAGRTYHLDIYQDGTGSRTITTYTNFISPAGVIPALTTTASARDEICLFYDGSKFTAVWLLNVK